MQWKKAGGVSVFLVVMIGTVLAWYFSRVPPLDFAGDANVEFLDDQEAADLFSEEPKEAAVSEEKRVRVDGVVLDAWMSPIRGATVITFRDDEVYSKDSLHKPGLFRFGVEPGHNYAFEIDAGVWGKSWIKPRRVDRELMLKVVFEAVAAVEGEIVGHPDRLDEFINGPTKVFVEGPIKMDNAALLPLREPVTVLDREALTFSYDGLGPGTYRVVAVYRGKPVHVSFEVPKNGDTVKVVLDLDATEMNEFYGRAVLASTGEPLPNTRIWANAYNLNSSSNIPDEIVTDDNGEFSFVTEKVARGSVLEFFRSDELPSVKVTYGTSDDIHVVKFPDPPKRQAVVVNRTGESMPFVGVVFSNESSQPGSRRRYRKNAGTDGTFSITNIEPGSYRVTVTTSAGDFEIPEFVVIKPPGEDPETVVIETDVEEFVVIRVENHEGKPLMAFSACFVESPESENPRVTPLRLAAHSVPVRLDRPEDWNGRVVTNCPDAETFELHVLAMDGIKVIPLTHKKIAENRVIEVILDGAAQEIEVDVVTPDGLAVEDAKFSIPYHTESTASEVGLGLSSMKIPGYEYLDETPWLRARKTDTPGRYKLFVFPGKDSVLTVNSSVGSVHVSGDSVLKQRRIVVEP